MFGDERIVDVDVWASQINYLSTAHSVENNYSSQVCVVDGRVYKACVFQSKASDPEVY